MCNLDIYRAPMQQNGILDDGKSEAGAAQFPRTPFVHAVEPLEQMRKMLRRNTCAIVRKTEPELVLFLLETLDCDGGAFTGVCDGIVRQISENRIDKLLASVDCRARCNEDEEFHLFRFHVKLCGFPDVLEHRFHVYFLSGE